MSVGLSLKLYRSSTILPFHASYQFLGHIMPSSLLRQKWWHSSLRDWFRMLSTTLFNWVSIQLARRQSKIWSQAKFPKRVESITEELG